MPDQHLPSATPWTLTARWIFPVSGPPLPQGTVTIVGDRITAVDAAGVRAPDVDLGDAAVLPGLVNAHTHLDLGGLRGRIPPSADFTGWLRAVIGHRRGVGPEQIESAVRAGVAESVAAGVTLLGDIAGGGLSWPVLTAAPLRAVVHHELLGLPQERAIQAWSGFQTWLDAHPATPTCRPGVSPHAPYSVRASLFAEVADLARLHRLPVSIHLAETTAELQLLRSHDGPFRDFLVELGVWDGSGLVSGSEEIINRYQENIVLFAHGNHLPGRSRLPSGATVVYCPRTHAAFGHPPHPFRDLLAGGVRVALGTDSLASNPDLDVLAEARFLRQRHPEIAGEVLLRMATLAGAEALGWQDETGSLETGKSADLVVLPIVPDAAREPHELVFQSGSKVQAVLFRGRWVRSPTLTTSPN